MNRGCKYFWKLLISFLLVSSFAVHAQQVFFNPGTIQIALGESRLVAIELIDVPESGLAAFQLKLNFNASILHILNPNEEFRSAGIEPFVPLGGNALCTIVRKSNSCSDPIAFLTSTNRIQMGVDKIDNKKGVVRMGYATRGNQALPTGNGAIALIEIQGVSEGVGTVDIEAKKLVIANDKEPLTKYKVTEIGKLSVIVGELPPVNSPPFLEAIGPQTVDEGELLEFDVTSTDSDDDALTLSVPDLPEGSNFTDNDNGTGKFSWTPDFEAAGDYFVTINVTDSGIPPEIVTEEVVITVNDIDFEGFPSTPTNLTSHRRGTRVVLRWKGSESTDNFQVFGKYEFKNGAKDLLFSQIGQTSKQIYIDNVPKNTVYVEYYLVANNDVGESENSQISSIEFKHKKKKIRKIRKNNLSVIAVDRCCMWWCSENISSTSMLTGFVYKRSSKKTNNIF